MRKIISSFILIVLLSFAAANSHADTDAITPSHVYAQALQIEQETLELQRKLGIKDAPEIPKLIKTELLPRHVWAKTYMLLTKISVFREQKKLPIVRPASIEPQLNVSPYNSWA